MSLQVDTMFNRSACEVLIIDLRNFLGDSTKFIVSDNETYQKSRKQEVINRFILLWGFSYGI
jgi:hypothetical protein